MRVASQAFLFFAFAFVPLQRAAEPDDVLQRCETVFGPKVPELYLFEANRFYVLSIQFDSEGQVSELAIHPKYYLENTVPDWAEPDDFEHLSMGEFGALFANLDRLRARGPLLQPYQGIVITTNFTHRKTDKHQYAEVDRAETWDRDGNPRVRSVKVRFMSGAPKQSVSIAEVIDLARRVFGPRVETPAFFEFDKFHTLRVELDRRGRAAEIGVEEKAYFRDTHPEWTSLENAADGHPLTPAVYQSALGRIDAIRPLGSLVHSSREPKHSQYVTGEYQYATLTLMESEETKGTVRLFTVHYK